MERARIPLLENIALISTIMPYYSYTHNAFLLVSALWSRSRSKLDEFYEEFRYSMRKYCMLLNSRKNGSLLTLPWDLFWFSISVWIVKDADNLIKLIRNIVNRKGYYFNEYYMSNQISLNKIVITSEFIDIFEPYIGDMKLIKVLFCEIGIFGEIMGFTNQNLLDVISLFCDWNSDDEVGFDFSCMFSDLQWTKINKINENFRNVEEINIWFDSLNKNI